MKKDAYKLIKLDDYIDVLTDYHSGGSYKTLSENTKILYEKDYAVMIRTLNFENNDFNKDLIYCDKKSYNFLKYSHVFQDDILMNKIANPGSVYIMPKVAYRVTCGMNLFLIRFKNINQRYMYYLMKSNEAYIKSKTHGTSTKTITKKEVRDLSFYIPCNKKTIDKIEHILSTIDYKININNKINDNLSKQLQAIYNYWFNQFEFPNKNGKPYKSSGGKLTYNKLLNQNIPNDFTIEPITNHIDWISGSQPPKSQFVYEMKNGYVRFIQNRDYSSNSHLTYIPISKNNKLCTEYDIMIDKYGEAGKTRFGIAGAYNVALSKVSVKSQIMQEYIRAYLSSDAIKNYLSNSCLASTRASLNESIVSNLYLLIPNKETLIQFEKIGKLMVESIIKNNREIEQLISIRDYLLPLLINGQATIL